MSHQQQNPIGVVIDKSSRVFISNIPAHLTDEQGESALRDVCDKYGDVVKYVLFSDTAGHFTGSAMCTYATPGQAKIAVRELPTIENPDGTMVHAAIAKEHGVAELSHVKTQDGDDAPQRGRGRGAGRGRGGVDETGRWTHDRFHRRLDGNQNFRGGFSFRGSGRGGGRGFRGGDGGQFHPFRGGDRGGRGARGGRGGALSSAELDAQLDQYAAIREEQEQEEALEGYAGDGSTAVAPSDRFNSTMESTVGDNVSGANENAAGAMDEES